MEKTEEINNKYKTATPKILFPLCTFQNLEVQILLNHYVISVDRYYLGKVDDLQYSDETTLQKFKKYPHHIWIHMHGDCIENKHHVHSVQIDAYLMWWIN